MSKAAASSSAARSRASAVQDALAWDGAMELAEEEWSRCERAPHAVNKYEAERRISALQGLFICDGRSQARHEAVLTELRFHTELFESLKRGTHLSAKEHQDAAKKKRRLSETEDLTGRFVQSKPTPGGRRNPDEALLAIKVKQSVHIKDAQGCLQEWLEGDVAKRVGDGVWHLEAASARLKRSNVKVFPNTDRADTDAAPEPSGEVAPPGQEKEGSLARVLAGARPPSAQCKWETWVLEQLPVGRVNKYHAAVPAAQGKKRDAPAYFTVDFRLRGRVLSGHEEQLVHEDEVQLVSVKIDAAGLEFLGPDDAAISTVTERMAGSPLQRPKPGQKVRCVRRIADKAMWVDKTFEARVSDLASEKDCAYFHDPKKGDCIRLFLEEGEGAKLAVFSRDPQKFFFKGALPDNKAMCNDPKTNLDKVPEALKVLRAADAPRPAATPFEQDCLCLAGLKLKELPQDVQLENGWGKLSVKAVGQTQQKGTAKLMIEVPFASLPSLFLELPARNCRRLPGEARANDDSLRRLLEPERFPVGSRLIMRLKVSKDEAVDDVSCRVLSYDESDKKKPLMTLAIPGEQAEYRLTLPASSDSFDKGAGDAGPVEPLRNEDLLPANTDQQLAALTKLLLPAQQGLPLHKENSLALRVPPGIRGAKEPSKWLSELQAEHATVQEDVGPKDKFVKLVFKYPMGKNYKKEAPRRWLGQFLFLDTAPTLNKPPRPAENNMVDIMEGEFKNLQGCVLQELMDDSDSFKVRVRLGPEEVKEVTLPAAHLWFIAPDDKKAEASAREGERLERAEVIAGASQAAQQDSDDVSSSSEEEELWAARGDEAMDGDEEAEEE